MGGLVIKSSNDERVVLAGSESGSNASSGSGGVAISRGFVKVSTDRRLKVLESASTYFALSGSVERVKWAVKKEEPYGPLEQSLSRCKELPDICEVD